MWTTLFLIIRSLLQEAPPPGRATNRLLSSSALLKSEDRSGRGTDRLRTEGNHLGLVFHRPTFCPLSSVRSNNAWGRTRAWNSGGRGLNAESGPPIINHAPPSLLQSHYLVCGTGKSSWCFTATINRTGSEDGRVVAILIPK